MKTNTGTGDSVLKQIADLQNLSHAQLQQLWRTLYGKEPTAFNRPYLIKRLAYRIQEIAYGGLSETARKTMDEILDTHGFDENGGSLDGRRTERKRKMGVPVVGTRLVREWNGRTYEVTVVYGGFEYEGRRYRSLTAIATAITGTHWNGRAFFGLKESHKKNGRYGQ
jgi:hypothetical protein